MSDVRAYMSVTTAYWGLTVTDGALRMLVLLYFHTLGYNPLQLAYLFLLYEAMGIATNFFGGWIGAKFGLRSTLYAGLSIQVVAMLMLSALDTDWGTVNSVIYVMAAQALSGIAKDLTKMSSKSAVKVIITDADKAGANKLFKWVALLTGSKNALKGAGFFVGGALLTNIGFQLALWAMAIALSLILVAALFSVRSELGKAAGDVKISELFQSGPAVNMLAFARIFLFAARDVWFVVGVPIFLYEQLNWSFNQVGLFMACWVIGYGFVQSFAPAVVRSAQDAQSAAGSAQIWGWIMAIVPAVLAAALINSHSLPTSAAVVLIGGLVIFGFVFAINSALHSYLIVALADLERASVAVGFYYMANAIGRFAGTLLSGLIYQYGGLTACLWVSAILIAIAAVSARFVKPPKLMKA